jgi:branched-chain amino acid transport system ATP-binding protein
MGFVLQASDRVLALNFGETITQGDPADVLNHPEVMKAYLGEEDALAQS